MKKILIAGGLILAMFATANAGALQDRFRYDTGGNTYFADREFSLDLFGLWASRERDHFNNDNTLGLGAGVNYFFMRYVGVGAESYLDDFDLPRHLDFSIIGRYPLEQYRIAPYLFAGFGRQFRDDAQWTAHFGGGVEYRLNPSTGFFADLRGIFPDKSRDLAELRVGVRFVF